MTGSGTKREFAAARQFVRLLRYCRLDLLASSFSAFDPLRTRRELATPMRLSGHKNTEGLATLKCFVCKKRTRRALSWRDPYSRRSIISFFSSAIALAGFSPFGHAFVQFKIVWQR